MDFESHAERSPLYWPALIASLVVAGAFAFNVLSLSLNIPFRDDFQDILILVVEFTKADSMREALTALVHQHADHLTYSSRLIYLLVYALEGEVNFITLNVVAHLGLFIAAYFFYLQIEDKSIYRPLWLICLLLLLFQPRAYTLVLWPMAAFQWYFSYTYVLASLFFLSRGNTGHYWAALVTAILATFTMSTGQLIWFLGGILIFMRRKDFSLSQGWTLSIWASTAVLVLLVFHSIYESTFPSSNLIEYAISEPLVIVQAFLAMAGSAVGMGDLMWSQIFGALSCLISLSFLIMGWRTRLGASHLFLLYCLGTIGIIVLGRTFMSAAFDMPLENLVLKPRYTFSSIMLWVTLFVLLVNSLGTIDTRKIGVLLTACVALNISLYILFVPALEKHQLQRLQFYNRVGMTLSADWPTKPTLDKAADLGIYFPPKRPYQPN